MGNYSLHKASNGLCRICGKSNKLPVHENCGYHRKKPAVKKAYTESQITAILRGTK